jgi:hypothetical protein
MLAGQGVNGPKSDSTELINVRVVYMAIDVMILMRATSIIRQVKGVGPEN